MKTLKTATGARFQFKMHPDGEIIVYPESRGELQDKSAIVITPFTVDLVKQAIRSAGRIRMGASRDNPPADSLGALLKREKQSPQQLCYLIPILAAEDFCGCTKDGQAVVVQYKGGSR